MSRGSGFCDTHCLHFPAAAVVQSLPVLVAAVVLLLPVLVAAVVLALPVLGAAVVQALPVLVAAALVLAPLLTLATCTGGCRLSAPEGGPARADLRLDLPVVLR